VILKSSFFSVSIMSSRISGCLVCSVLAKLSRSVVFAML